MGSQVRLNIELDGFRLRRDPPAIHAGRVGKFFALVAATPGVTVPAAGDGAARHMQHNPQWQAGGGHPLPAPPPHLNHPADGEAAEAECDADEELWGELAVTFRGRAFRLRTVTTGTEYDGAGGEFTVLVDCGPEYAEDDLNFDTAMTLLALAGAFLTHVALPASRALPFPTSVTTWVGCVTT